MNMSVRNLTVSAWGLTLLEDKHMSPGHSTGLSLDKNLTIDTPLQFACTSQLQNKHMD